MPSLSHKALQSSSGSHLYASGQNGDGRSSAVWTRSNTGDVSPSQLHKFWSGLSAVARRELLRIDKQTLFEQVRKNLYCSRCHGLLVEGFSQIILYGKSLQAGMVGYSNGGGSHNGKPLSENGFNAAVAGFSDDTRDPSVHPWGGLAATRDSMLTVLDCFLDGMPLEVFESARARERERELLYPDACGGGGRGWICQNGSFNGRGHGMKETCALHTARLSCEALVDFWSALGDETRRSLLRMKEEDFIERLMFRFDSKRFCRDCRRNVLREFKEMKELKRSRKEPQCTRWFCAADTIFRYEVSESAVQVDWRECFAGDVGSVFQRFEWAVGTGEGKSDILGYEDVGLSESAHVDNLDLANTSACFVTVRGWKRDGRCTELSAKAHALKGQLCVHRRLIVGDGFVSITKGESIQRFFERAEETEEEEDEDAIDKDGNDYEGEGSRPQKHAKSPELARDFLLDAATVIFKEQVEKAFREGTARQNAHSIFVCLALSLLEERVRVACKEITTLEKQNKLLEEEEYEKREEEERRERRKQKEKEKKLRRKEKLRSKEKGNRNNSTPAASDSNGCLTATLLGHEEEREESSSGSQVEGTEGNNSEDSMSARPSSPDMVEARPSADGFDSENGGSSQHETFALAQDIEDVLSLRDGNGAFIVERSKSAKRRTQGRKGPVTDSSGASHRRGPSSSKDLNNGIRGNPPRAAPAASLGERRVPSPQGHPKNGLHKIETETMAKRVDSWSRTQSQSTHNRHEDFQSCACGSSHTSSRAKAGQRAPGRAGGRETNVSSHKSFERLGSSGDSATKASPRVGDFDPGPTTHEVTEHPQKRLGTALNTEHKEERAVHNTDKTPKAASYSRSSSLESAPGMANGYYGGGGRISSNGTAGQHGSLENGAATPVSMKPVWTPRAMSGTISSNGPAVKILPAVGNPTPEGEHGKSAATRSAKARPSNPGTLGSQTSSPKTSSVSTPTPSERTNAESPGTGLTSTPEKVQTSPALDSRTPVQILMRSTADGGPGSVIPAGGSATKPGSPLSAMASPPSSSTASSVEPAAAVAAVALGAECAPAPETRKAAALGLEGGEDTPQTTRPVLSQGAVSTALGADPTSQAHHADLHALHISGSSPPPHLHANGHPAMSFHPSRPQPKSMYAFSDMVPIQGPMQHTMQIPNMLPGPMNIHHQQPFGYYQVGPWAVRGRNGVLPLPQPGFLIPGPGGLGLSMGVLPPMSLPGPGSHQSAPVGLGVGRLPAMPNGLNPLQFRQEHQQVFLSRFGDPGRGSDPRALVQMMAGLQTDGQLEAAAAAADSPAHVNEGKTSPGLSNGATLLTAHKENGHNDPPPSTSDFSFFHSGWPISRGATESDAAVQVVKIDSTSVENLTRNVPEKPRCIGVGGLDEQAVRLAKPSCPAGEYSLFASAPSKGFAFF